MSNITYYRAGAEFLDLGQYFWLSIYTRSGKHALNIEMLIERKRAPHCVVQSRFRVIYIYTCMSVCLKETHTKSTYAKMRGRNYVPKHAHAQSQFWVVKSDL